jgi:hypothetical protein
MSKKRKKKGYFVNHPSLYGTNKPISAKMLEIVLAK